MNYIFIIDFTGFIWYLGWIFLQAFSSKIHVILPCDTPRTPYNALYFLEQPSCWQCASDVLSPLSSKRTVTRQSDNGNGAQLHRQNTHTRTRCQYLCQVTVHMLSFTCDPFLSHTHTPDRCTTSLWWEWLIHTAHCHNETRSTFSHKQKLLADMSDLNLIYTTIWSYSHSQPDCIYVSLFRKGDILLLSIILLCCSLRKR